MARAIRLTVRKLIAEYATKVSVSPEAVEKTWRALSCKAQRVALEEMRRTLGPR